MGTNLDSHGSNAESCGVTESEFVPPFSDKLMYLADQIVDHIDREKNMLQNHFNVLVNFQILDEMKQSGSQHSLIRPRIDLARSDGLFHAALMGADACEALATFTQDAYIYI